MTENTNSRNWYDKREVWISIFLGVVIGAVLCAVTGFAVMPSMMITTFESKLPFDKTVESLQKSIEENGWQVSAVMNVNKSLEKNNVQLEPKVKIIKLCHPEYAKSIVTTDRHISVMMPCSFAVWQGGDGKTYLSKMNMSLMADMFGGNIKKIMGQQEQRLPLIGKKAPEFEAETTQGTIKFPKDYKGKWVILFSHPADFTPVCTTEFMTFACRENEFKELGAELIGLSIDSTYSHIAWLRTIKKKINFKDMKDVEINFPVISDLKMEVAKKFGMIQPAESTTQAVRAVFIIDPKAIVRAILYYPLSNGRNVDEIKRILVAMQHSDKHKIATPANWNIGDDVIVPPPGSCGTTKERVEQPGEDYNCLDWFLCLKKCEHK